MTGINRHSIPFSLLSSLATRHYFAVTTITRLIGVSYEVALEITKLLVAQKMVISVTATQWQFIAPIQSKIRRSFKIRIIHDLTDENLAEIVSEYDSFLKGIDKIKI